NVHVRIRGGSARNYYKKNYKFDFNKGHWFRWADDQQRVSEINLNSTWADKAYVRQVLAFETFRDALSPYCETFHVRLQQNGQFFSVAIFVEQVNEQYLQRNGYDTGGALYKFVSGHTPGELYIGVEKKTRLDEDHSDLAAFYNGLRLTGDALLKFLCDNVNVAEAVNYYAAMVLVNDGDHVNKNHYLYRDTEDTGLWSVFPWDKDLVFGRSWSSVSGVLNDNISYVNDPINGWWTQNLLGNAIINHPVTRQMYLARVRTLMDELLQTAATPAEQRYFESRIDELVALIGDDVYLDAARWRPYRYGTDQDIDYAVRVLKNQYLAPRRTYLAGLGHIPPSQPASPAIAFGHVEYNPPSGNQDEEYIEIVNGESCAIDISGWRLADGIDFVFPGGTVIPAGTTLYVTPDVATFRFRATGPGGGQGLFVVGNYSRHVGTGGEAVRLLNADGEQVDVFVTPAIQISEVMYGPAPQQQWIELYNPADRTIDISGWYLSDDAGAPTKYRIPDGVVLGPGAYRLFTHAGHFGGAFTLAAAGGTVVLTAADQGTELQGYQSQASYGAAPAGVSAGRYVRSDGQVDFTLLSVPTPGWANAQPWAAPVVINELMYRPPGSGAEFIELINSTDATVPLYDPAAPGRCWRIRGGVSYDFPAGSQIAPHQAVLIVGVDLSAPAAEAAFRAYYGIAADVPIFGPYSGALNNSGENVELLAAGLAGAGGPYVLADRVEYGNLPPWPAAANGLGPSLERVDPAWYGNDPAHWQDTHNGGSPGRANVGNPSAPSADAGEDFGVPDTAPAARLDGAVADDGMPVGGTLTATWSFVSGPAPVVFDDPHDPRTTVTFPTVVGQYVLKLTADDGDLSRSDTVTVMVGPPLTAVASASVTSGKMPLTIQFTASATGGLPEWLGSGHYKYTWDFGDGETTTVRDPAHTYRSFGTCQARLTVSDGASTDSVVFSIIVGGLLADANGDGMVGIADLAAVADNYGLTGAAWCDGDFNNDGIVGIADLAAIADGYGRHV
ncbi:MAG TPA: lamin tail domain-containing protein, partial [Phycisphaerae bacterium]|nr:lamin tail domain-containing protein [Phycisphaerae bacterium]